MTTSSVATAFGRVMGDRPEIRVTAYDGSTFGDPDAHVTLAIRAPEAVQYLATAPGDLGLARAFVSGALAVDGSLHEALTALVSERAHDASMRDKIGVLRELGSWVLRRPPLPPEEASPPWRRGLRHSKERDAKAVSHHYDVSNRFYEMVLGPSMTYTCAVYPESASSLEEAQATKYDLVARKLALEPSQRLPRAAHRVRWAGWRSSGDGSSLGPAWHFSKPCGSRARREYLVR